MPLGLAAQHHLVDQRPLLGARDPLQHRVEIARMNLVARRQGDIEATRKSRKFASFSSDGCACTRYMHGCRSRSSSSAAATLARIMNSSMSRWLSSRGRGTTGATRPSGQLHLALRQIEIERATARARPEQRAERIIQRAQPGRQPGIPAAIRGGLHLLISKPRRAAHQPAAEPMARLASLAIDPHVDEQAPARLARLQTAPAVGQRLRQHRHDAVGEIAGIAAVPASRSSAPSGRT